MIVPTRTDVVTPAPAMDGPRFSVVVPTCHRNESLAACLEKLAPGQQVLHWAEYEVVVTDDGSMTTAEAMLKERFPWVRWTPGARRGPAANRNQGAKCARGEWLVFTDDDCLPDPAWLQAYSDALMVHPRCRVFEGRTYADRPQASLGERSPVNENGNLLYSCNCMFRATMFTLLGGFDERFPAAAMEDLEFADRIRAANEEIVFVPAASVCHPWRDAGGWQQLKMMNNGILTYLAIHPSASAHMNPKFYLKASVWILFHEVLRALFSLDGRGVQWSIKKMFSTLLLSFRVRRASAKPWKNP